MVNSIILLATLAAVPVGLATAGGLGIRDRRRAARDRLDHQHDGPGGDRRPLGYINGHCIRAGGHVRRSSLTLGRR